jgi:hypothetical protein
MVGRGFDHAALCLENMPIEKKNYKSLQDFPHNIKYNFLRKSSPKKKKKIVTFNKIFICEGKLILKKFHG